MAAMFLEDELNRIRAGRANVAILDGVRVSSYGSKVPLNQVATVNCPDARTIAIKPWDRKQIKDIDGCALVLEDLDPVQLFPEKGSEFLLSRLDCLFVNHSYTWNPNGDISNKDMRARNAVSLITIITLIILLDCNTPSCIGDAWRRMQRSAGIS